MHSESTMVRCMRSFHVNFLRRVQLNLILGLIKGKLFQLSGKINKYVDTSVHETAYSQYTSGHIIIMIREYECREYISDLKLPQLLPFM